MSSRRRRGFTLTELIVVVILSALVLAGLAAIYGTGLRQQLKGMRTTVIQNRALVAAHTLQAQLEQATAITEPAGVPSAAVGMIAGGINVDAATGQPLIVRVGGGAEQRQWFRFCVAEDARCAGTGGVAGEGYDSPCLWWYSGAGWPPTAVGQCGDAVGGAEMMMIAAPLMTNPAPPALPVPLTAPFRRTQANVIQVDFNLTRLGDGSNSYAPATPHTVSGDVRTPVNLIVRTRMAM